MKFNYKILALGVSLLGVLSCESILDQAPIDVIDTDRAFENAADVEAALLGAYAAVGSQFLSLDTYASDESRRSNENRGQGAQVHNWTYVSGDGEAGGWSGNYAIINRVNRILDATRRLKEAGVISDTEVARQEAEAYALRAYAHFSLWRVYSGPYTPEGEGIPLVTLEDTDNNGRADGIDPFFKPSRNTSSEVFAQIESDIQTSLSLMPSDFLDKIRMNRAAVIALSARVALYKEDWAAAETLATQALELVPLESRENFAGIWTDASRAGVISVARRVVGNERIGTFWRDTNGDVFFHPSNELVSLFDPQNDIRYASTIWVDPSRNLASASQDPQATLVAKYRGPAGTIALADVKLFRSAEMILIRAEARLRKSSPDIQGANADLNTLRSNRILNHVPMNYTAGELLEEILLERRKELAFEGHRFFDLKRNGLGVSRIPADIHINGELEAGNPRFNFPIPQTEIFANDNVIQNPGYN